MNTPMNRANQSHSSTKSSSTQQLAIAQVTSGCDVQAREESALQSAKSPSLMQTVLDGFMDGVLILSEHGKLIYGNSCAHRICCRLLPEASSLTAVPQQIWRICEALLDSRSVFPDRTIIIEDEIAIGTTSCIRIRARWIDLSDANRPYLSITLEDRQESLHNTAIAEARKYNLTPREAEVWRLRKANCTYKAIAAELHIAIDTVKKHLKNIHAKREAFMWANE